MLKETTITLTDAGNELTFKIKQMPATKLEGWILRALLLLASSGQLGQDEQGGETPFPVTELDPSLAGAFLMKNGLKALARVDYEKARPLLDDLLNCCWRVDNGLNMQCDVATADTFIQEVKTLFRLRSEALKLNLGFSLGAAASASASPRK